MRYRIGDEVGDYLVTGFIGAGATGQVFLVEHNVTHRVEAMKVLTGDSASTHQRAQRFLREAKVQAKLDHPNITAIHNAFWVENDLILIMEYVDGESLRQIIERGEVPLVTALSYARQILRALGHAHQRGVIHRDISPSNILVTRDGRVKLTDFGLAKEPHDLGLTISGSMLGSLHYSSPEQIRSSSSADARSDLYSCGAVFYELFTLKKAFDAESAFELMLAHWEQMPAPPIQINPHLPEPMNAAILRALEKDSCKRFGSASEFLHALQKETPETPDEGPHRIPPLAYAAVAFLAIVLTLAGVAMIGKQPPPQQALTPPAPVVEAVAPPTSRAADPAPTQAAQPEPVQEQQLEPAPVEAMPLPAAAPKTRQAKPATSTAKINPVRTSPEPERKVLSPTPLKAQPAPEVARKTAPPTRHAEDAERTTASTHASVEPGPLKQPETIEEDKKEDGVEAPRRPGILRSIGSRINIFRKKQQESKQQQ